MRTFRRLAVFCGSSHGIRPSYTAAARHLGTRMAERGIGLVYGGGSVGLMGEVATAALAAGGEAIGVIPAKLQELELGKADLTELYVVPDMHARKRKMAHLSDGFVVLPGGYGTLEELFEAVTWTQLGSHDKPVGLLDVDGYYAPLAAFIDRVTAEGFVRPLHRPLLQMATDADALIDQLAAVEIPELEQWIDDV
mgnify:CR=1 FL=1